jgi:hypothetical protein
MTAAGGRVFISPWAILTCLVALASLAKGQLVPGVDYDPDRVFVRFRPEVVAASKTAAHSQAQGLTVLKEFSTLDGLQLIEVAQGEALNAVTSYAANPDVLYAEPVFIYHFAQQVIPGSQWGLHNVGDDLRDCWPNTCAIRRLSRV